MIATGIILIILGILAMNGIAWTIGIVILILGLVASLLGMTGHPIGRRHYF